MTLLRLLCWLSIIALLGQGFAASAQSLALHHAGYDSLQVESDSSRNHAIEKHHQKAHLNKASAESGHQHPPSHHHETSPHQLSHHHQQQNNQVASSHHKAEHSKCGGNKPLNSASAQQPPDVDKKPDCCSDGNCKMNCQHQNGNSPCSIGCEPVQANTVMLVGALTCHDSLAATSEAPCHNQYWRDSPPLSKQTPPPKFA